MARKSKFTRGRLVGDVRAWAREHGHSPSSADWRCEPGGLKSVYRIYPSWPAFLAAAKLPPPPLGPRNWDRERAIEAIVSFTKTHGRPPIETDLGSASGLPARKTLERLFGTVTQAREAAGVARLDPWREDEAILRALVADSRRRGRAPTVNEWRKACKSRPTAQTVCMRFGGWPAALVLAGLRAESELPAETPCTLLKAQVRQMVTNAFDGPERTPSECLAALIEGLEELRQQASL